MSSRIARPRQKSGGDNDWGADAACAGEDVDLFYGVDGERGDTKTKREKLAKRICRRCPVSALCLDFALRRSEQHGVWGALTPEERAKELLRRASAPPPPPAPKPVAVREKQCRRCGVIQPAAEFGQDAASKDGLHKYCRECTNEDVRRRRREAKQAVIAS
jgi:WhiB family redox-sensing transcriptional regulator